MLNEDYIFLDVEESTKENVLRFICEKAKQFHITDQEEDLYIDFMKQNFQLGCRTVLQFHMLEQSVSRKLQLCI